MPRKVGTRDEINKKEKGKKKEEELEGGKPAGLGRHWRRIEGFYS